MHNLIRTFNTTTSSKSCTCVNVCMCVGNLYVWAREKKSLFLQAKESKREAVAFFHSLAEAKTEIKSYILDDDEYRMKTRRCWGKASKDLIFINKQSGVHRPEVWGVTGGQVTV